MPRLPAPLYATIWSASAKTWLWAAAWAMLLGTLLTLATDPANAQSAPQAQPPSQAPSATPIAPLQPGSANPVGWGTAFVVSEGYLLTSLHLVRDKPVIFVGPVGSSASGQPRWVLAELVRTDASLDLALLKARIDLPALALHPAPLVPLGLEVSVIGYPQPRFQGMSKKITQGIVNGYRNTSLQSPTEGFLQISAEVSQGNSGGPVLAPDGTVIGMVQSKLNSTRVAERTQDLMVNVSFALRSSELIRFLQSVPVQALQRSLSLKTLLRPFEIYEQSQGSVLAVIARGAGSAAPAASAP